MKQWQEKAFGQWVYFDDQDGKIIGAVYKIGTSNDVWGAKVYLINTEEQVLGQYINSDYARKASELFWEIDSRTVLEYKGNTK